MKNLILLLALSTNLQGLSGAPDKPFNFILTSGYTVGCKQTTPMIENKGYTAFLTHKEYAAEAIATHVAERDAECAIPAKESGKTQGIYDQVLYKMSHTTRCLFGFSKHCRRFFSELKEITSRFQAFLHFLASLQWLK